MIHYQCIKYDSVLKDILNHKGALEVFERVIKEGRKFGFYLMLAS